MPSTPVQALPYPALTDPANGPVAVQNLGLAAETKLVMVFASAADRDAKITAPTEGMLCWLQDVNIYAYYDGVEWSTLATIGDWTDYTPEVGNIGAVTYNSRVGRWKRIAAKTIAVSIYINVGSANTGNTNPIFVSLPTAPNRIVRWVFSGNSENPNTIIHGVCIFGGTGAWIDRVRTAGGDNIGGNNMNAGRLLTLTGTYEEAV